MDMSITVTDIKPKSRKRYGVVYSYNSNLNECMNADIEPGVSIRIYGTRQSQQYDLTFKIGDTASPDSYNLIYTGKIVAIGPSTVTIHWHSKNTRLGLYEFSWRNYDFNAKEIADKNFETSQYI
jgi:hypothetical protein